MRDVESALNLYVYVRIYHYQISDGWVFIGEFFKRYLAVLASKLLHSQYYQMQISTTDLLLQSNITTAWIKLSTVFLSSWELLIDLYWKFKNNTSKVLSFGSFVQWSADFSNSQFTIFFHIFSSRGFFIEQSPFCSF